MFEGGLDIALMVILGYFALRGLFRGAVKEVVAVLGLFVAFWVAGVNWELAAVHLAPITEIPGERAIGAFIIIFLVVYFFTSLISIFVDKMVKTTISPLVSGLLGIVVGLSKGVLVCGVLMTGALVFLKQSEPFFTTSRLWPYLKPVTVKAQAWMPESLHQARSSKAVAEPLSGSAGRPPSALSMDVDWKNIQDILKSAPDSILPAWREKFQGLSGGQELSDEDKRRFISDHPTLFSRVPPPPAGQPTTAPAGTAPTWPQPATE